MLFLQILGDMCLAIVCFLLCDIINFEINFIFPITPFSNQDKNILRTKKGFTVKKSVFHAFYKVSVAKNCLRPKSVHLRKPFLNDICERLLLFIVYKTSDWCQSMVRIGSPALTSFYCVRVVSFIFFLFFLCCLESTTS